MLPGFSLTLRGTADSRGGVAAVAYAVPVAIGGFVLLLLCCCCLIQRARRQRRSKAPTPSQSKDVESLTTKGGGAALALRIDADSDDEAETPPAVMAVPLSARGTVYEAQFEDLKRLSGRASSSAEDGAVTPTVPEDEAVTPTVPEDGAVTPTVPEDEAVTPTVPEDGAVTPTVPEDGAVTPTAPSSAEPHALTGKSTSSAPSTVGGDTADIEIVAPSQSLLALSSRASELLHEIKSDCEPPAAANASARNTPSEPASEHRRLSLRARELWTEMDAQAAAPSSTDMGRRLSAGSASTSRDSMEQLLYASPLPPNQLSPAAQSETVPSELVDILMEMGFEREASIGALARVQSNPTVARTVAALSAQNHDQARPAT